MKKDPVFQTCLPTKSATLFTSLNAGNAKAGMLVERPKGYRRASGSMFLHMCLQKMHVQRDQPAGDPGWLPKRRTWRRFKRPIQPTLRRKKRFRQRHLEWQQRQQLQQQHHHHWQTQRKWRRQLQRQQQQHVQWMQHISTLQTLLTKRSPQHWKKRRKSYKQGEHLYPVLARNIQAHNQEGRLNYHQDKEKLWPLKERSVWRRLQIWPPLTSRRKDLHFHELQRHRARYRKGNLKRKRRTINLLLPGTSFRMMFAPVPTMTIHFMLFVFVCPSLVLIWWRPCTVGHLRCPATLL